LHEVYTRQIGPERFVLAASKREISYDFRMIRSSRHREPSRVHRMDIVATLVGVLVIIGALLYDYYVRDK